MKRKILMILHLPPPVHGAAMVGKFIHDSREINDKYECRYLNLSTSKKLDEIGKVSLGKLKYLFNLFRDVRKSQDEFRPDYVYVTASAAGKGFIKDFFLVRMIKRAGFPVVVHFHNKGVAGYKDSLHRRLYRSFFNGIKVIQISSKLYPDIESYVSPENVIFCPNGVADPGVTQHKDNLVPHILFLSNLIESKGILVLLDACRLLHERGCQFVLDIAGGESKEISAERLKNEINARDLAGVSNYHGRVLGQEKEEIFNMADVFAFPTFYPNETFGLVAVEAMAHSLPVVSSDEGSLSEIVRDGETGFVVERKNPDALADALGKLLTDSPMRREMGEKGRERFLSYYTLESFEQRFMTILNDILSDNTVCV